MSLEEELAELSSEREMLLTIGVFDGVHLGHKYLISQLMERARQQNLLSGVITFRQHPLEVLSPQTRLSYLTSLNEKVSLLKAEGVDAVIPLYFTREVAQLSARQFVSLLKKYLKMCGLMVGPDFTLGRNREGGTDTLRKLGLEMGFSVAVIPPLMINGEVVSSTAIREALARGDVKKVVTMIGRPFSLHGKVMRGTGQGSGLGFPTANLEAEPQQALPADGVYATWTYIDGKTYKSMTNIGRRPTFGGKERTIETYILNYNGNLYGHEFIIDIVERVRSEKKFDTIEDLKKQIAKDVKQGAALLKSEEETSNG